MSILTQIGLRDCPMPLNLETVCLFDVGNYQFVGALLCVTEIWGYLSAFSYLNH